VDLRTLSLCSGVGGIDLGLRIAHPGARTVCYVEREAFCASVLAARMDDGSLDQAPVWDDVTTFDGRPWRGAVDLVAAGFPCQPVSIAGKRGGMDDKRFIWDDIARIIGEVEPRYVFLENVPGILTADGGAFLDRVLSSLVVLGFDCEWDVFSAEETGAPHKRQRWFCLAVSNSRHHDQRTIQHIAGASGITSDTGETRLPPLANPRHGLLPVTGRGSQGRDGTGPAGAVVEYPESKGLAVGVSTSGTDMDRPQRPGIPVVHAEGGTRLGQEPGCGGHPAQPDQEQMADADGRHGNGRPELRHGQAGRLEARSPSVYPPARNDRAGWAAVEASLEPAVCRDADGLDTGLDPSLFAYRQDRLRAVGNGVVPLTCALAWVELNERMARHES
jgi:DNA (cytosine-5)-methyltransferase 1